MEAILLKIHSLRFVGLRERLKNRNACDAWLLVRHFLLRWSYLYLLPILVWNFCWKGMILSVYQCVKSWKSDLLVMPPLSGSALALNWLQLTGFGGLDTAAVPPLSNAPTTPPTLSLVDKNLNFNGTSRSASFSWFLTKVKHHFLMHYHPP